MVAICSLLDDLLRNEGQSEEIRGGDQHMGYQSRRHKS
jgi:hypothetical protein